MVLNAQDVLRRIQDAIAADSEQGAHWLNNAYAEEWATKNHFLAEEISKLKHELETPGGDRTLRLVQSIAIDIDCMRNRKDGKHWFGGFTVNRIDFSEQEVYIEWPNLSILAREIEDYLTMLEMEGLMPEADDAEETPDG